MWNRSLVNLRHKNFLIRFRIRLRIRNLFSQANLGLLSEGPVCDPLLNPDLYLSWDFVALYVLVVLLLRSSHTDMDRLGVTASAMTPCFSLSPGVFPSPCVSLEVWLPTTSHLPDYLHLPSIKLTSLSINTSSFQSFLCQIVPPVTAVTALRSPSVFTWVLLASNVFINWLFPSVFYFNCVASLSLPATPSATSRISYWS